MKKRLYILGTVVCTVVAVTASYFYADKGNAWLLAASCSAVILLLICVVNLARLYREKGTAVRLYRKKAQYLTLPEQNFFRVLKSVLCGRYEVYPQAPLVSVIDKPNASFRNELFRIADFVVINPATTEPLLLIELNDSSHNRADRRARDQRVAGICADAGIPIIAFTIPESKDTEEVKRRIFKAIK